MGKFLTLFKNSAASAFSATDRELLSWRDGLSDKEGPPKKDSGPPTGPQDNGAAGPTPAVQDNGAAGPTPAVQDNGAAGPTPAAQDNGAACPTPAAQDPEGDSSAQAEKELTRMDQFRAYVEEKRKKAVAEGKITVPEGLTGRERKMYQDTLDTTKYKETLESVNGCQELKDTFQERIFNLFEGFDDYESAEADTSSIMLLFGPGGTGKSLAYRALQGELAARGWEVPIFVLSSSSMEDKYIGESQKRIEAWFSMARKQAPCILVMEEVDSVMKSRDLCAGAETHHGKLQSELLHQMQREKLPPGVILICNTNRAWVIDPAFTRRMSKVYMRLPSKKERYTYCCKEFDKVSSKFSFDPSGGARAGLDDIAVLRMIRKFSDSLVNYSNSDLKEVLSVLKMSKLNEAINSKYWTADDARSNEEEGIPIFYPSRKGETSTTMPWTYREIKQANGGISFSAVTLKDLKAAKDKVAASNSNAERLKYDLYYKAVKANADPAVMLKSIMKK